MRNVIQLLYDFVEGATNESVGIELQKASHKKLKKYLAGKTELFETEIDSRIATIRDEAGIEFPDAQRDLFYLGSFKTRWNRRSQTPDEGVVSGGTYINGILDTFLYPVEFWDKATRKFAQHGLERRAEIPTDMRWIESTTAYNDPEYTPQFGCVKIDSEAFPTEFYFYDSGFVYRLPFTSFEEYFTAMAASAMVRCWQYFYIDPQTIVAKNRDQLYLTWSLHVGTRVDERLRGFEPVTDTPFDRLDLIHEYLHRCITLLPGSFPFLDFDHHQEHFAAFEARYRETGRTSSR